METGSRAGTKELGGGDWEQGGHQRAGRWGLGAGRVPKSWVVGTGSRAGTKELGGSRDSFIVVLSKTSYWCWSPQVVVNRLSTDSMLRCITFLRRLLSLHPPGQHPLVDTQYREFVRSLGEAGGPFATWEWINGMIRSGELLSWKPFHRPPPPTHCYNSEERVGGV